MERKWRCPRCGHEVVESPEVAKWNPRIPRCHSCETREELYPGGPKIWCPMPMVEVREAA